VTGPDVAGGDLGYASLYDLCPTLLWWMGMPIPADADGRVLFEAFGEGAVAARELREVDATASDRPPVSAAASAEVERRLRALGYL
jgi:arylsulfatase A-like enzyme